tara:strand:+ start:6229 stop:7449 length:1221 start_codon:yes stop_codon:yes gene_type:complete
MSRLINLYKTILTSAGLESDAQGRIYQKLAGESIPCTVGEKLLLLPTKEVLKDTDWTSAIAFHPLSENVARGESPIIKKLKELLLTRATRVLDGLAFQLLSMAANTQTHEKFSPAQLEYLTYLKDADGKMVDAYRKMIGSVTIDGKHRLINMYLKRSGTLNDTKYARLCITSLPILDKSDEGERTLFGHKVRKRDFTSIPQLFEYILPGVNENAYSYGTHNKTAPFFHALMLSYLNIAKQLNQRVEMFKEHLVDVDDLLIDVSFEAEMGCLSDMRDEIPPLEGNQGDVENKAPDTTANVAKPANAPASAPKPVEPKPSAPAKSGGAREWNTLSGNRGHGNGYQPANTGWSNAAYAPPPSGRAAAMQKQRQVAYNNSPWNQGQNAGWGNPQPQNTGWNQGGYNGGGV